MRRLADTLILYTEAQAEELKTHSPSADVVAAPNALYSRSELDAELDGARPHDFVYVGRLTEEKKPDLVLSAFSRAAPVLPSDIRLVFVGDGPLRARLEADALASGLEGRVFFLGHVSDVDDLRGVYAGALASVSPGYIGLSLIQSLGFGVPMIAARDEPHSPEIEAAREGENVAFVASDSPEALASALESMAADRDLWASRRAAIAAPIRSRYSIEGMVASFVDAIRLDDPPSRAS
jgi:glycosyltransferase involved in cell wall biosynthesis